jgi:tetratricopeptide (TPR) repeat protein
MLVSSGDKHAALDVLQKAREVSPGTMSRIRELSNLALSAGKPELAETVMRQALQKHKYSPVREAGDYVVLSNALVNQGKAEEALSVVADAQKTFNDEHSTVVLATSESAAHRATGNHTQAEAALVKAMSVGDLSKLPAQAVLALADVCFAMGQENDAKNLLRHAIQNNPENEFIKNKVHEVLTSAGKDAAEATAMIDESTREVILLNNEGVRKAEAGELAEAIELLCQAANRLPNNMQIVSNAALVIALDLERNGNNPDKLVKCLKYREALIKKSPDHPKLVQIDGLLKQLKQ